MKLILIVALHLAGILVYGQSQNSFERDVVLFSSDKGLNWQSLSFGLPENTQASFLEKKGSEIVLATDNRGLFITQNNKKNWKSISQNLPTSKINSLHILNDEIYVGLYGQGIFRSRDNGNSWESLNGNLQGQNVQCILAVNRTLLIGTDNGIFKSQYGFENWTSTFQGSQILSLNEFQGKIVAGTSRGVLLSTDNGKTWKHIHDAGAIHYTAFIEGKIYAMYISGDVYMSEDLGNTWLKFNYTPNHRAYIYELVKVTNDLLMSNSYGLFRSKDNGKTWDNYYKEERFVFFDFLVVDDVVYGATRFANEFRNRK